MSRGALAFTHLGVRRMPGIADGGWSLPELSPGVNVVWGPNGAGKTTTAAALERVLWPRAGTGSPLLDAHLDCEGVRWEVDVDGAAVRFRSAGSEALAIPGIPSEAERDRYRLSLHDLLHASDGALAERIVRESAGGFDVAAAAAALGFRERHGTASGPRAALAAARERLDAAREAEAASREEEARLDSLREEARGLRESARWITLRERALEHLDAVEDADAAREALAAIPAEVERVAGGEGAQLRDGRTALAAAEARLAAARREAGEARTALAATGLPEEGVPAELLGTLRAACDRMETAYRDRRGVEQRLAAAREEAEAEWRAVAGAVGEAAAAALDLPAVEAVVAFAERAEAHRAELRAAEAERAGIGDPAPEGALDRLQRGRHVLSEWLRAPDETPHRRARALALAGALLAAAVSTATAAYLHPAAWGAVLLALALLWLAAATTVPRGRREALAEEYAPLELDAPVRWEPEAVGAILERLEREIAAARLGERLAERRREVERRIEALRPAGEALAAERTRLVERLGLAPETGEATVAWLCQRLHGWRVARGRARGLEAEIAEAGRHHAEAFAEIEKLLREAAVGEIGSAAEVAGVLDALRARRGAHEAARAALEAAEGRARDAAEEAALRREECAALLARAGLPEDGDLRLEALCTLRPAFLEARDRAVGAERAERLAARRLEEAPGYDAGAAPEARPALAAALAASREAADRLGTVDEEIARLDERLRAARSRTAVEEALAGVADAEAELRASRDRDEEAVVGWGLRAYVEAETRDRDRPGHFHRARALFASITRGRYRLELSGDAPSFHAVDTSTGRTHTLDELSRGTRLQLLLAVRIAFVETVEPGPRLPLVLDEALGNSDDERAAAVMDAVIELAREGRQIFFLTARHDEAGRWIARLREAGVPHALVDLGAARRSARFVELSPAAVAALRLDPLPPPEGADHAAYGTALGVPAVGRSDPAEALHLWYLEEDPERLHRLLGRGAERWGALRTLVDAVGPDLLGVDAPRLPALAALARGAERHLELRRIGHGRPVDEAALDRSGAISGRYREEAESIRKRVEGDARALIAGIGELPGFRQAKRDELATFLEEEGYLDRRPPLDDDRVRDGVLASLATDLRADVLTVPELLRAMARIDAALRGRGEAAQAPAATTPASDSR